MKKTAIIFSLLMLLFSVSVSADTGYNLKETELLSALNIIDEELSEAEEIVTRGEFAGSIVRFMAIDSVPSMYDASFADVTEYSDACNSIYYLKSRNILSGAGDGNFYPDIPITKKQAAIVIARVLGYGAVPGNTEEHAAALGIIGMSDDALNYGELVSVLYNALDCKCVIAEYGSKGTSYKLKENYLSETFGAYRERGIVRSNSLTTLDGNGEASVNIVKIGNHELKNNGYDADALLGMSVDYYYITAGWYKNEDKEDTLLCAVPTSMNTVTEILAKDITSFDGRTLKYLENNKSRTISIDSSIDVIYNGVACPDYEIAMLSPQCGKITYIENGTDSDCVKIEEYRNGIVSSVSSEYIYLKNGSKIDLNGFGDDTLFLYDKDGNAVEDIPVNSVLSMFYSADKDILKAVYSTDVLDKAKVRSVDDEYIVIDAQEYFVNKLYLNWKNALKDISSATYKIYLDAYGEVAKIEKASGGKTFGYLISAYENEAGDGKCVNVLLEDGGIESIECSSKINVNGSRVEWKNLESALMYSGNLEQLITYQTNADGKITSISTAVNRDTYTGSIQDKEIDDFKISYMTDSSEYYKTATKVFGTSCPVDELTKVFFVADKPQQQSEEYYWSGSISSLENDDRAESAVGYKTSSQLGNAEAMVVYGAGASGTIGNETRISVVKKIETTVNEDDEPRVRVTFITGGKLVAYNLSEDLNPAEYNLSKGDLVRFAIDRNYEVSTLEMLCDLRSDGTMAVRYGESNNYANTSNAGGAVFRIVSGSVYDYDDGLMCLSKGDVNGINLENPQFEYYRGIAGAFICVVDDNEITAGSDVDIVRYTDNPDEYSKAFITTRYGAVRDVVIYK